MKLLKSRSILLASVAGAAALFAIPAMAGPHFHHDYNTGIAAAKAQGKPSVVVFSASWCGPCRQMKSSVYPSSAVAPYHNDFVWIYLDIDDPKNASIVEQHRVGPIPHISFKNSAGRSVDTLKGGVNPAYFADVLAEVSEKNSASRPNNSSAPSVKTEAPKKKKGFGFFKRGGV